MLSLFATCWSPPFVICHQLSCAVIVHRHCPTPPSLSDAVATTVIVDNLLSLLSLIDVSCSHCLLLAVAVLAISCLPLPPFLVGGRHPHHLSSAIAVTLVAAAVPHRGRALSLPSSPPVRCCCRLLPETVVTHHHHPYSSNTASAHHSRPSRILPPKKTC